MSGTKEGGKKAVQTNYARHGKDFYREIGRKGGANGHTGGFAANPQLAKIAGAIGGRRSKRGPAKPKDERTSTAENLYKHEIAEYAEIYG